MQRIRSFWQSGIIGKIVLSVAGIFLFLILCCVIILIIPSPKQNTATKPTTVEVDMVVTAIAIAPSRVPTAIATSTPVATETPAPTMTPEPPTVVPTPAPTVLPRGYVSHTLMGDKWPLTIEEGAVVCDRNAILLRAPGGQLYAVNGIARGQIPHLGWKDIRDITLPDPQIQGLIMNVQPIVDVGLDLCM